VQIPITAVSTQSTIPNDHIVRPGVSGWAQVHQGNVAAIAAARRKREYDFFYIKHFSFWLDAAIVLKTLRAILTRFGSR
jgi:lipopolysaccharide/colanic/teichoic acid biosynthesis glycosyltransferase